MIATQVGQGKKRIGLISTGIVGALLVAFTFTPTFAGFAASIQNTINSASTGTLTMKETSGTYTCNSTDGAGATTNSATCSTINKYGGTSTPLVAGGPAQTTNITLQNTGSVAATSFSLNPGTCSQSTSYYYKTPQSPVPGASLAGNATDLCSKVKVAIKSGSSTLFTGTAAQLQAGGAIDLLAKLSKATINAGESVPITFEVSLDASAGPTYQGLQVSQPLTWTFGA